MVVVVVSGGWLVVAVVVSGGWLVVAVVVSGGWLVAVVDGDRKNRHNFLFCFFLAYFLRGPL